jgi:menaquinone-dependent protoporphyrinogen IX oxidase
MGTFEVLFLTKFEGQVLTSASVSSPHYERELQQFIDDDDGDDNNLI